MSCENNPYLHCESREKPVSYVCVMCPILLSLVLVDTLATGLPVIVASHRSAAESWTEKKDVQPCYTPFHVLPSPTRWSLLTETANSEQLLMVAAVTVARCFIVSGRSYGLILATVCGLDYWFACYHIHRYVALSVIGHRMCNRMSGLCDKGSITKRVMEVK